MTTDSKQPDAIILAAGQGRRMGSDKAKVLHQVAGRPMLWWVVKACQNAGVARCIIVVGYQGGAVKQALAAEKNCVFVQQPQQQGTGHAVEMARPLFDKRPDTDVFVLAGDGPLIRAKTLNKILQAHRSKAAVATVATAVLDDPAGYGRVIRTADGGFEKIVEQKDAGKDELAVCEINPSYYCFNSSALFDGLSKINANNSQGEYYLTDVPQILKEQGKKVCVVDEVASEEVLSINTPTQLAEVDSVLTKRIEQDPEVQLSAVLPDNTAK